MEKSLKDRVAYLVVFLIYLALLCFFYNKYIPLHKSFQIALIPVLLLIFVSTCIRVRSGILIFVFFFPLINNLPYFFGIDENIPHASTALALFLFFFLGWLFHYVLFPSKISFNHPVFKPLILFGSVVFISGIITFFRYANFFPFASGNFHDLIVNVIGVRAGGAIMSDVFCCMNYLTGFLFFIILFNTIKSKGFAKQLLVILSVSILISLLFALIQIYYSKSLGNTAFWVTLNRINSSFKDPNSFGIVLSFMIPLLIGMFFSFRKNVKYLSLILIVFSLFIFPSIGSRSGFLGLVAATAAFVLMYYAGLKISFKKKIVHLFSFFLIIVLVFISFNIFSKKTNLYERVVWSMDMFSSKETLNRFFTRKLDYWAAVSSMMKEYPFTGVGVGAFVVELPNHLNKMGRPDIHTDSAENYFFQVGSELGIIGLFLIFWLFFEVFKQIRKGLKGFSGNHKDRFILIGAISGIVSFFVNSIFHSYIGAFDVKYFFWFLIAVVFIFSGESETRERPVKWNRKFSCIAMAVLLSFGAIHLWNSTHSLSLEHEAEKYKWNQNFGFYQQEIDDRGVYFKWAKKLAGICVENVGHVLNIPIKASHPDLGEDPVKVKIYSANHRFENKKFIEEITLDKNEWVNYKFTIPDISEEKIYLVFETSRSWQPLNSLGIPDPRWIAIALGNVWFEYPDKLPGAKIISIQKVAQNNWEGEHREKIYSNGSARIRFSIAKKNVLLRLHIRGQKAFDLGPYLIVRINDRIIGRTLLTEDQWTSLVFSPEISEGEHVLSVEFINDFSNPAVGRDRNVFLGDLEIVYIN
jgi:hypothetical protein